MSKGNRVGINWTRSIGSALGAVSSAVLLSTLGVAGTLIGAALGSLILTVGGAVYSNSLQATRERVFQVPAPTGRGRARADREPDGDADDDRDGDLDGDPADDPDDLPDHEPALSAEEDGSVADASWKQMLRDLPWKRMLWGAAALFAVAMALILAFELFTGRAVSSFTGGSDPGTRTSIPGFDGSSDSDTDDQDQQQEEEETPPVETPPETSPEETPPQETPAETPLQETPLGQAPQGEAPQREAPQPNP